MGSVVYVTFGKTKRNSDRSNEKYTDLHERIENLAYTTDRITRILSALERLDRLDRGSQALAVPRWLDAFDLQESDLEILERD